MYYTSACYPIHNRQSFQEEFNTALKECQRVAMEDARDPMKPGQRVRLKLLSHAIARHPNTEGNWLTTVWRVKIIY